MAGINALKSRRDFERVFSSGKTFKNRFFVVYSTEGTAGCNRFGICVGKSIGIAVVRNRLKRQIREILRGLELKISSSDVAVIARKSLLDCSFNEIKANLLPLLSKARLL